MDILQNLEKISFLETLKGYTSEPGENIYLRNITGIYFRTWRKYIVETLQGYTSEPGENIFLRNITGIYFRTRRKYLS